jgi:hypothetical protein
MKPSPQERALEWLTLVAVVIMMGVVIATLSILRDREGRFDRLESAIARIEQLLTTTTPEQP